MTERPSPRPSPKERGGEVVLTVLMPCLNEAATLAACIAEARAAIKAAGIDAEVLIADNGSDDGSPAIAAHSGARVVHVPEKGYGNALRGGIAAARGEYVIMADADGSYDFSDIPRFLDKLREGFDLVMGNRFRGGIQPGAMPWLHRYVGNPLLSGVGRLLFGNPCGDFHCGLRGFRRAAALSWGLRCGGMEFASGLVVQAALHRAPIAELPITLRPDGRGRAGHLRSFRDGWRHLRYMVAAFVKHNLTWAGGRPSPQPSPKGRGGRPSNEKVPRGKQRRVHA